MEFYLGSTASRCLFFSLCVLFRAPAAFPNWFHSKILDLCQIHQLDNCVFPCVFVCRCRWGEGRFTARKCVIQYPKFFPTHSCFMSWVTSDYCCCPVWSCISNNKCLLLANHLLSDIFILTHLELSRPMFFFLNQNWWLWKSNFHCFFWRSRMRPIFKTFFNIRVACFLNKLCRVEL